MSGNFALWSTYLNIFVLLINLSGLYDRLATCKGTFREMTFHKGQGNVREFRTMVNVILNTKKVREMSGNFIIFAQNSF